MDVHGTDNQTNEIHADGGSKIDFEQRGGHCGLTMDGSGLRLNLDGSLM